MKKAIKMDEKDNVATALAGLVAGEKVEVISSRQEPVQQVTVNHALPLGHKIALADIPKDSTVTKYGATIGKATRDISVGDYVHIHNVRSDRLPLTDHMLGLK
ncbi:MAG: UxaA family hydrolase [Dehalococcoidia bacterium]|nr:UxaA family hydrolase [Dehalococcoidia bacterium]